MAKCSYKSCNNPSWSKGRCKMHPAEKPKPMKRTRLAHVSKKRAKELRAYNKVSAEFKAANPTCCIPGCNKPSTTHHSRGRIGKDLIDVSTFRGPCWEHHIYYETHPAEAMAIGLTESRLAKRQSQEQ